MTVQQLRPGTEAYPATLLAAMGRTAPELHLIGNAGLLSQPGIGFCGSRKASDKGLATARDCAEQVARAGIAVVSGNASGVDLAAHQVALESGGCTILVLPEGTDHFRIKRTLADVWDWDRVLVISPFEPNAIWKAFRAMARNEVIIGLSQAMIVIEAGATGGTLDAGLRTLAVGKPLFVALYEQMGESAEGNTILLQKGGIKLARARASGRAALDRVYGAVQMNPTPKEDRQYAML